MEMLSGLVTIAYLVEGEIFVCVNIVDWNELAHQTGPLRILR